MKYTYFPDTSVWGTGHIKKVVSLKCCFTLARSLSLSLSFSL